MLKTASATPGTEPGPSQEARARRRCPNTAINPLSEYIERGSRLDGASFGASSVWPIYLGHLSPFHRLARFVESRATRLTDGILRPFVTRLSLAMARIVS